MIASLPLFATLIAFSNHAAAFSVRPTTTTSRLTTSSSLLHAATYRDLEELEFEEDDGEAIRVKVEGIERDWEYDGFKADGEMSVDLFLPGGEDDKIKGCVFFMHGFSQYPVAYRKTLKKVCDQANVAVIAVETGVTSKVSRDKDKQLGLQRAVSQDTAQCIRMVKAGDECFAKHGIPTNSPMGICGHSMGGGLSFPVAAEFEDIHHVFAMAPAPGVSQFDPIKAIEKGNIDHAMLVAGDWDLIAKTKTVHELGAALNKKKEKSSLNVDIARGTHTGFEDKITLFSAPLGLVGSTIFLMLGWEVICLALFAFFRTRTGQLEASQELMSYFFTQMANEKDLSMEDAEEALDNMKERLQDKVVMTYAKA